MGLEVRGKIQADIDPASSAGVAYGSESDEAISAPTASTARPRCTTSDAAAVDSGLTTCHPGGATSGSGRGS